MSTLSAPFQPITSVTSAVGEGPVWDPVAGELLWVDVHPGILHRLVPSTAEVTSRFVAPRLSFIVTSGTQFIGGYRDGLIIQDLDGHQDLRALPVDHQRSFTRPNDGACDPLGRLWFGTVDREGQLGRAHLYSLDGDRGLCQAVDGISMSNGLSWSPGGDRLYYIDSVMGGVDVFDYDVELGVLGARRRLADTPASALPDGMAVDSDGCIWVAMYRGGHLVRFSPDGAVLEQVSLPTGYPTSCAFGGPQLDQLFVTTSNVEATRNGTSTRLDGVLLVAPSTVPGLAPTPFAVPTDIFTLDHAAHLDAGSGS